MTPPPSAHPSAAADFGPWLKHPSGACFCSLCATMRRPYVLLDWPRFNAIYDLAAALFGWLPVAD